MSRREGGRDTDSKRHRSRFYSEPSPKRSRRDGKPATERVPSNTNLDAGDHTDRDQKHRRRLQDALPLEAPSAPKVESGAVSKESDKKPNGHDEGNKPSSNPTDVPRSRSYFQHDERGHAGQVGRSFGRRAATERGGWKDSKDQHNERAENMTATHDAHQRDEKSQAKGNENSVWRHDKFETQADQLPPARKRPAFREKKIPVDSDNADKAAMEPEKPSRPDRPALASEKREDRSRNSRHLGRAERTSAGDRVPNWGEAPRGGFSSRERYGSGGVRGGNDRGRDTFSGRQGYRSSDTRVERWAHDMFDEASKSPPRKNEEEQIAKVEALLAS